MALKSLTIGLNQHIFTNKQTPYTKLFDENCILDISRVKSAETRALLMGLVVYILNEYRIDHKISNNEKIKHVTVLEEAHNLLKNTSASEKELIGKSVEMITQSIAEIRTCGEGFIIVDQSPSSVDIAAIKNTNTKIVLRTPEANDREAVGRSIGLNEEQINEIAKLPNGVAVVYQNDWVTPVLTMVDKAKIEEGPYINTFTADFITEKEARTNLITLILDPWIGKDAINNSKLLQSNEIIKMPRQVKKEIELLINQYCEQGGYITWTENDFKYIHELILYVVNTTDSEIANMGNANNVKKYISEYTIGLSDEDVNVVGYYLSYVEGSI